MNIRYAHPEAGREDRVHGDEAFPRDAYLDEIERQRKIADVLDRFECDSSVLGDAYRAQGWDRTTFQAILDILADKDDDKLGRIRDRIRRETEALTEKEVDRT